jgi:hypothetical protein
MNARTYRISIKEWYNTTFLFSFRRLFFRLVILNGKSNIMHNIEKVNKFKPIIDVPLDGKPDKYQNIKAVRYDAAIPTNMFSGRRRYFFMFLLQE